MGNTEVKGTLPMLYRNIMKTAKRKKVQTWCKCILGLFQHLSQQ